MLTRRQVLRLGRGFLAGLGAIAPACAFRQQHKLAAFESLYHAPLASNLQAFGMDRPDALKDYAAARNLLYGAAANPHGLSDPVFTAAFLRECAILVPENELKWQSIRPSPTQFDFSQADRLLEVAQRHHLLMRGHTLVWDQALPDWFDEAVDRQNAEQVMTAHIAAVASHFAGQLHSWDVVNEAIAVPYSQRSDGLHPSPWLELLGESYIETAFYAAAEADPQAMLVYNDRWLDYDTPRDNAQREAVLNLLEKLISKGVPVHALGIQAHLMGHETRFNADRLRTFLRDVASLGLKILITELDVTDRDLPADVAIRDSIVATAYETYLNVVLEEPAVVAVLTWGLSDRYTWLSSYEPRPDGLSVRPLPLDEAMNRKLVWTAIARAFEQANR
ncbi:endo-1,4-beta-xylanase [Oscillatoria sp. FACHB-1407]|uniref:endo-1,4-beta-xylanase n=1 Tax=Oscillatoria sp. FACHB-1407 TaxID=2692847 RepID=UPI001681CBA9|nr:endo-1,4-beta-xylanase [Oscillatoria sp. FACHB-1407]MBD2459679.1 endo-1,4-beta-xylanase [Oscillatoria sp. FACHB-1407]